MYTYAHTYYEMIKEKSLKENKNFKSMRERGEGIKTKHTSLKQNHWTGWHLPVPCLSRRNR